MVMGEGWHLNGQQQPSLPSLLLACYFLAEVVQSTPLVPGG